MTDPDEKWDDQVLRVKKKDNVTTCDGVRLEFVEVGQINIDALNSPDTGNSLRCSQYYTS